MRHWTQHDRTATKVERDLIFFEKLSSGAASVQPTTGLLGEDPGTFGAAGCGGRGALVRGKLPKSKGPEVQVHGLHLSGLGIILGFCIEA